MTRQHNLLHVPSGTHTNNFLYSSVLVWNNLRSVGYEFNISFPKSNKEIKAYFIHNEINIGYISIYVGVYVMYKYGIFTLDDIF